MVNCKVSAGVSLSEEPTEGQKEAADLVSGSGGMTMTKDLGYANGWNGKMPEIIGECESKGHTRYEQNIGRCLHEYGCEICAYKYYVDSSD